MSKRTRLQPVETKVKPAPVNHIKLDPLALKKVKQIIRPSEIYVILSETEALIVPKRR